MVVASALTVDTALKQDSRGSAEPVPRWCSRRRPAARPAGCSASTPAVRGCESPWPAPTAPRRPGLVAEPARASAPGGIDAGHLLGACCPLAQELLARGRRRRRSPRRAWARPAWPRSATTCAPAAGRARRGVRRAGLALAADAVTAYAGALGVRPRCGGRRGHGHDRARHRARHGGWRRADGWGHLLGDCGQRRLDRPWRAWRRRCGPTTAAAGGSAALLARAEAVFGPARPGARPAVPAHRPARRTGLLRARGGALRGATRWRPASCGSAAGHILAAAAAVGPARRGRRGAHRRAVQDGRAAARAAARPADGCCPGPRWCPRRAIRWAARCASRGRWRADASAAADRPSAAHRTRPTDRSA